MSEGAIGASPAPGVFVDSRRESKGWIGTPDPRYFAKRGCKLMKTKDASTKKRARRKPFEAQGKQEAANN